MIGTTLGLIVGFAGCKAIEAYKFPLDPKVYFISSLPTEIRPSEFIVTALIAIGICLLATIFPSLYAARLRPTDGLRAE
jgi:lipoprotein-releasing system permease protein